MQIFRLLKWLWVFFYIVLSFRDECVGIGEYRDIEGTDVWCQRECLRYPSTCPQDKCSCFPSQSVTEVTKFFWYLKWQQPTVCQNEEISFRFHKRQIYLIFKYIISEHLVNASLICLKSVSPLKYLLVHGKVNTYWNSIAYFWSERLMQSQKENFRTLKMSNLNTKVS